MQAYAILFVIFLNRCRQLVAVLDIDSKDFNTFDETDQLYLEKILSLRNSAGNRTACWMSCCQLCF